MVSLKFCSQFINNSVDELSALVTDEGIHAQERKLATHSADFVGIAAASDHLLK